jgi:acyl-CoA-binding protein
MSIWNPGGKGGAAGKKILENPSRPVVSRAKLSARQLASIKPSAKEIDMSQDLQTRFETAQKDVQSLSERPDNATMLQLYALYKQSTQGDVSGSRPGMMDFVGRAKYDAWAGLKGKTRDQAMQAYIDLVTSLQG